MKKAKVVTPPATPATPATAVVAATALTRRNATPSASVLVLGPMVARVRAPQNARVWTAIVAALPATAAALAALPEVAAEAPKVTGAVFVSYALRRSWLAVK